MKTLLLSLITIFSFTTIIAQSWVLQTTGTASNITDIQFVSDTKGWATVQNGKVLSTNNGGVNWTQQNTGYNSYTQALFFISATQGWICCDSGKVFMTTDGGNSWTPQPTGSTKRLYDIHFFNSQVGCTVGADGVICWTNDGGANWAIQASTATATLLAVRVVSPTKAFVGGLFGNYHSTINAGVNWTSGPLITGLQEDIFDLFFLNESTGWGAVGYGLISRTTNGGANWSEGSMFYNNDTYSVYFTNAAHGYAVTANGRLHESIDSGKTWSSIMMPYSVSGGYELRSIHFEPSGRGWIACDGGRILAFNVGTGTGVADVYADVVSIYPNPANNLLTIHVTTAETAFTTIYDLHGKKLLTAIPEKNIDISAFPAGIYIAEVEIGNNVVRKKWAKQ